MATRVTQIQFSSSIVRIFGPKEVVGMGLLVGDRQVITCRHVISEALRGKTLQSTLCLDFPLISGPATCAGPVQMSARVSRWYEPYRDGASDIAILELDDEPPPGARSVCLVDTSGDDMVEHKCRVFGCPYPPGGWFDGITQGRVIYGWVQINGADETGYFVKPGFSGTPVWDKKVEGVVGIIVGRDRERKTKVAFMIPTDLLVKAWTASPAQLICGFGVGHTPQSPKPIIEIQLHILSNAKRFQKVRGNLKKQIAKWLQINPDDIDFGNPKQAGSIRVNTRLPKSAADRLYQMILDRDARLDDLGISNPFDNPGMPDPNDFPSRPRARKALGMSG